jgi:hypothetical protein
VPSATPTYNLGHHARISAHHSSSFITGSAALTATATPPSQATPSSTNTTPEGPNAWDYFPQETIAGSETFAMFGDYPLEPLPEQGMDAESGFVSIPDDYLLESLPEEGTRVPYESERILHDDDLFSIISEVQAERDRWSRLDYENRFYEMNDLGPDDSAFVPRPAVYSLPVGHFQLQPAQPRNGEGTPQAGAHDWNTGFVHREPGLHVPEHMVNPSTPQSMQYGGHEDQLAQQQDSSTIPYVARSRGSRRVRFQLPPVR